MKSLFFLISLSLLISCGLNNSSNINNNNATKGLIADKAMVVSAREEASNIGIEILKKGGNAFDAMIATEFALAVAYPVAGNLGGGGFMVYRQKNGAIGALDYREKAPLSSSRDMYLDKTGNVIKNKSLLGATAVAVPGTVAGMFAVHEKFGSLPIEVILQPVIDLANRGVVVTKKQAARIKRYQTTFLKVNQQPIIFNQDWKENDIITYPALAKTLTRIKKNGEDEFYRGETAKKLVSFIQKNGGYINQQDLSQYQAKWRKPITFNYDDLRIISMSPPSSGGICLAQIFNAIEPFDLSHYGHNSVKSIQVITEAERRAYADRSHYLGDPDFINIPVSTLIGKPYTKKRMRDFSFTKASKSSDIGYGNIQFNESTETTHYSIVDPLGNVVSATTTLNANYGSKLYSSELGFFFNNEMDDFSSKPGTPNLFGLIGAKANQIAPEKRMLSSMSPTIIEKDNQFWMVLGSPGGSTIITSVLQTILNVHEFGFNMQEAVSQPRFHHQWLPDVVTMEPGHFDQKIKKALGSLGYTIEQKNGSVIGKVDAILKLPNGKLEGGADPRGDDKAVGF